MTLRAVSQGGAIDPANIPAATATTNGVTRYPSGGGLMVDGTGQVRLGPQRVRIVTAGYTPTILDYTILVDATAGAISITLPASSTGYVFNIKKIDASANVVTVVGNIDGAVNKTLTTQYQTITVQATATAAWYII